MLAAVGLRLTAHPAAIGGNVKRTIWIALATGTMISGAAAIGVDAPLSVGAASLTHVQRSMTLEVARRTQREAIDARYQAERAKCEALGGLRRDNCLIDAHARRGRAMLEAATPYAGRA
jgi:hypothetical protein